MPLPYYGVLLDLAPLAGIALTLAAALVLAYLGAGFGAWTLALALLLWGWAAPAWLWLAFLAVALVFNLPWLRRVFVSAPLMRLGEALDLLPTIGETERVALEAGTTWIEGDIFTGKIDFRHMLQEPYPQLSERERAFLDGPVDEVCRMLSDWEVHQLQDLPEEVWAFLRRERFFGLVIPQEHGGHGFSALGVNAIIAQLGSRSIPLAVDVMVPNSLGPAELLMHYGTPTQRDAYLPRLATGEEMPCFALTEPEAGSDAAAIQSEGVAFLGEDERVYIRLNWQKRYITMAPIATMLGLAFRLRDPENLLGKGEEPGITVALVPTRLEGVDIGRRHNPLNTPFVNGPTRGRDVVVSADQIIGGPDQAGNGWRMLMETLARGRGIFIPGLNTGGAKLAARVAGGYAAVRRQFGLSIGRFEGVEELLTPIAGLTYLMEAMSRFVCGAVDRGGKPAVASAIAKYHSSEFNRQIVDNAMDILGGVGIMLGPSNLLAHGYVAVPIAITVEGSNVVTRSLIIFGQGLIRYHPYAFRELEALEQGDLHAFDDAIWAHLRTLARNAARALVLGLTGGLLAFPSAGGPMRGYYRRLAWSAAVFATLADAALLSLGGGLKIREKLSGRFADALSWIFLCMCALRRFEAEGRPEEQSPLVRWVVEHGLHQIQGALLGILDNFPVPILGWLLGGPVAWWGRIVPIGRPPDDRLGKATAAAILAPGRLRDRLTQGIFLPAEEDEPLRKLEHALDLSQRCEDLYARIRQATRHGRLPRRRPEYLIEGAFEAGIVDEAEFRLLQSAESARREVTETEDYGPEQMPMQAPQRYPVAG